MEQNKKIKLTPKSKELLLNLQGGAKLMWSYKQETYWRFCGKGFTVYIKKSIADKLVDLDLVYYSGEGVHEGERVARYSLTELGKTINID